jgi:succinoglycan biosynthesis transport protein ExoP
MRVTENFEAPSEAPSRNTGQSWSRSALTGATLFCIFVRRWRTIAAASAAGALLGIFWLFQVVPVYTATTTLLIEARRPNLMRAESVFTELALDATGIATELSLIQSFAVARRVAERLNLDDDPNFNKNAVDPGLLTRIAHLTDGRSFAPGSAASRAGGSEDVEEENGSEAKQLTPGALNAIAAVQSGVEAQRVGSTRFITVSYSHRNPRIAARLANAIADTYLADQLEARRQSAKRATGWLSERVSTLRRQVEASERAVAEHRARHNLTAAAAGSLSDQQAAAINAELVAVHADAVQKRAKYEQARGILEGGRIESVAEVMQSPAIATLRASEAQTAHEEADLRTRYGPEHPKVKRVRGQRADLRRQIKAEIGRVVSTLKTDYELAKKKEATLEQSLRELTRGKDGNDQAVIRLRELEREAESDKALYESLLSRLKEAEQQTSLPSAETRVVAPALTPGSPSFPNTRRMFILATAFGVFAGCCLAYLLEQIEKGFTTMEQAEEALQLPVLALVPHLSRRQRVLDGEAVAIPEYVADKPLSRFSETVRSIRVSARMSSIDAPPRALLVTSSTPGEGKTTIAQCLVYSAAAAGQKVLAIDCDLRHPTLTREFGLADGPGLTDLLGGQISAGQAFCNGPLPNLTILPAGTITRHPPDMLGSDKLRVLLEELKACFDLIVIDSPPVAPVADCILLSKLVDKVVFVVQWRTTPRNVVERTVAMLNETDKKIAGIALNDVRFRRGLPYSASYGYYSRHYYKYYEQ